MPLHCVVQVFRMPERKRGAGGRPRGPADAEAYGNWPLTLAADAFGAGGARRLATCASLFVAGVAFHSDFSGKRLGAQQEARGAVAARARDAALADGGVQDLDRGLALAARIEELGEAQGDLEARFGVDQALELVP